MSEETPEDIYATCWEAGDGFTPRKTYEFYEKEIPKGSSIHHLCGDRNCINPKHMRIVERERTAASLPVAETP